MLLGFSDGVLNNKFTNSKDRYNKNYLNNYFFNSLEMHCGNHLNMDYIIEILDKKLYSKFKYISLHAPIFYKEDYKNISLLNKIKKIHKKFDIKNIVVHPDNIINWNIFDNYKDLPISLENMDKDKINFKDINDFEKIIYKKNFNITLDLNHIHSNDKSMSLAEKFQKKFKNKIVEYHISSYDKKNTHIPLFKNKKIEILKALKFKNIPIIIESECEDFLSLKKEYNFINNYL